jgi:diaminohydroxyphosphoribosylaminopyrimidine deaminase/5-amino-6-(5-phosphoribosylamino)uracil reductase
MTRNDQDAATHTRWMGEALSLARRGLGGTSPNPMVGAVIVKDGGVVGQGFHQRAGGPHAEVHALAEAGEAARGATAYVTLEPCCHHGRTPPCTDALIAAGVTRVVYGRRDRNPRVDGGGVAALEAAGIVCEGPVLESEAAELNRAFEHWISTGRPYVVLKLAMSIDGRIAKEPGPGHAVTGPEALSEVQALRAAADAIAVGSETALSDDPRLTLRGDFPGARPPERVVFDSRLRVPKSARIFSGTEPGAIALTALHPAHPRVDELRAAGVEVISAAEYDAKGRPTGRVDLELALSHLGARTSPITNLLVEGGGGIAAALLGRDLVDELVTHIAPDVYGAGGVASCGSLKRPAGLERVRVRPLGVDLEVVYRRKAAPGGTR